MISGAITQQLKASLDQQFPQMSDAEKWRMAKEKTQTIIETERGNYETAVANAVAQMSPGQAGRRKIYMLEADPYHYWNLTEEVAKKGRIADEIKNGRYRNPLMRAPHGYWTDFILHPYLGYLWYRLLGFFKPGLEMMEALNSFPLLLDLLIIAVFLTAGLVLGQGTLALLTGALTLMLSPIFIQRSAFGWYDTDPYNYLFPIAILCTFFIAVKDEKKIFPAAAAAGLLTGLYTLFWTGWAFILAVIPFCLAGSWILLKIIPRFREDEILPRIVKYFIAYVGAAVIGIMIFLTPKGALHSLGFRWEILHEFALSKFDIWPNMFITVGEAQGIGLKKLVFLAGNYVSFAFALAGFVLSGARAWFDRDAKRFLQWIFLALFSFPLLMMALKTERFTVLFVMPLAFFAMLGMTELRLQFEKIAAGYLKIKPVYAKVFSGTALLAVFLPLLLIMAHIVALGIKPIMNDAWYDTLAEMKVKTPQDAIINSWWPPGYFVQAIANRRVVIDGGTQHLHEAYWMAKALVSPDERESAGILRMLDTSGNDALEYLVSIGYAVPEAVDVILSVVPLNRAQAAQKLSSEMQPGVKNHFLDLTHGTGTLPPAYLFLYNDLIEQNLAVTVAAEWNFHKAREMQKEDKQAGFFSFKKKSTGYLGKVFSVLGGVLRYTPEAGLQRRDGNLLIFANGLAVDLATKDAQIILPSKGIEGRPMSLFYIEGDQLIEKKYEDAKVDVSALITQNGDTMTSVIADPRLIRSTMFRLYYLRGAGLTFFKPFQYKKDPASDTTLVTYELRRDLLTQ